MIGCGGWGTALGLLLHRIGHNVTIWGVEAAYVEQMRRTRLNPRYLAEVEIPGAIGLTSEMADCVPASDVLVAATPTIYMRSVCERLAPHHQDR